MKREVIVQFSEKESTFNLRLFSEMIAQKIMKDGVKKHGI